jgi:hypothetical protein
MELLDLGWFEIIFLIILSELRVQSVTFTNKIHVFWDDVFFTINFFIYTKILLSFIKL